MTETFPGYYLAGDYQEQKTPETEHPADSESQADDLTVVDPESLREDGGVVSGRMGNLALETSGVAASESDRSEAASQDSSDPPRTLSPAEELRARLAGFQPDKNNAAPEADSSGGQDKARADLLAALRGGGKESPDASSQASEKAVKTISQKQTHRAMNNSRK